LAGAPTMKILDDLKDDERKQAGASLKAAI
jgi:hypothetical protein